MAIKTERESVLTLLVGRQALGCRGVATEWTWVVMSTTGVVMPTPLLPADVPWIDADLVSFFVGVDVGVGQI